jgi:sugar phosphate isomerase/epimerase
MKKLSFGLLAILFCLFLVNCQEQSKQPADATDASTTADTSTVANPVADWKLGVQLWTFHKFPFVTAIAKADSAGIKFIEAFPGQPMGDGSKDTFGINMSADSRKKVKDLLAQKGLTLVAFGVVGPQTPAEWRKTFDFAKDMGLRYITAEPLDQHWDTVNTMAGEYGIMVAIHDHPKPSHYWHPDSVMAAIKGRINLGSCADIGHWTRSGLDPVQCLKTLEGRIIGVHLKDVDSSGYVNANDVLLGKGVINFPAVFGELKRQNFKGMFSIEREANWDNNVADVIANRQFFEAQVQKLK